MKRSVGVDSVHLEYNISNLWSAGGTLVSSAVLRMSLATGRGQGRVVVSQVIENSESGITLDTQNIDMQDEYADDVKTTLSLDVSHALQAWLQYPHLNLGLSLSLPPGTSLQGEPELVAELRHSSSKVRAKRSLGERDWRGCERSRGGRRKCCRRSMKVRIREMQGFSFIYQPAEFDAAYCAGSCPVK